MVVKNLTVEGEFSKRYRIVYWGECGFRFIPAGYSDVKPAPVPI
jgi:hypothetical protein